MTFWWIQVLKFRKASLTVVVTPRYIPSSIPHFLLFWVWISEGRNMNEGVTGQTQRWWNFYSYGEMSQCRWNWRAVFEISMSSTGLLMP